MTISAQVSLYPLGRASLSSAIEEALEVFRKRGLRVEPGSMSSLIVGDEKDVFEALRESFRGAGERGPVVMVALFSNACPVPGR